MVRISLQELAHMEYGGVGPVLNGLYAARAANKDTNWLQLDALLLGFMRHDDPLDAALNEAVTGGILFRDSLERDDCPRAIATADVRRLARALERISDDDLRRRHMATRALLGDEAVDGMDDDALAHIQQRFAEVVEHFRQAVVENAAILLVLV